MEQRTLPRLNRAPGVVGLGTRQLGAGWGTVYNDLVRPQVHDRW